MTDSISPKELILGERAFLHDLSNQLVIAQGMGSYVMGQLKQKEAADSKEVVRMEKVMKSVDKIIELVRSRRDFIKSQNVE